MILSFKKSNISTCLLDCAKILNLIDGYFWPKTFVFIFSGKVYWFGKRMDAKICYVMRNWRTKNIKTAPKTYKNNNIRKTKNQEISSSRFLFPPTPLKKNITNRVWQNWKTIHLKKSLPVLLIFILEIKRTHILKYFFFVKSYFDFIFWNDLVPLCKQVKKIYNFFLPSNYPLCKNISFFFVLSL